MNQELKRKRFLMLSAAAVFVALLVLFYVLGSVLITVMFSALIAYVLLPLANVIVRVMPWSDRRPGLSRGIAVGLIFLLAIGIFAGSMVLVIPPTIEQGKDFIDNFPTFFNSSRMTIERWVGENAELVPDEVRVQIEENIAGAGAILVDAAWEVLPNTVGLVSETFALIIGFATMPVLIFYFVKDSKQVGSSLLAPFPKALRPYLVDVAKIGDKAVGGYLRGQLILGAIVGIAVTIGLMAMGVPFAAVLGVIAGLSEMIPIVGPLIGGAAGILVTLATAPEKVIWVAVLYLGVQLVENTLLVPRVQAGTLNLHPVAVIFVIIVGGHFFGIWGIIFGPPLVSMGRDVIRYIAREWDEVPSAASESENEGLEAGEIDVSESS
ncbi:MAG: AI-2E family transporter [Chloroflexi bacterium]|nr:AI-2E family transporter [Chloroflexota bacterium]